MGPVAGRIAHTSFTLTLTALGIMGAHALAEDRDAYWTDLAPVQGAAGRACLVEAGHLFVIRTQHDARAAPAGTRSRSTWEWRPAGGEWQFLGTTGWTPGGGVSDADAEWAIASSDGPGRLRVTVSFGSGIGDSEQRSATRIARCS